MGYLNERNEFEVLKNVHIFVKDGNLVLKKTKMMYKIHKHLLGEVYVTHSEPIVSYEEVPLCGYGYNYWDFVPLNESSPDEPNFYQK